VRTFVDSGVLIAAATGRDDVSAKAMAVLDDPTRVLVASDFVRLEVLPKPVYERRGDEAEFYEAFFDNVEIMLSSESLVGDAYKEACSAGLSALDALHVAAAKRAECHELVTAEKEGKPLFRAQGLKVRTIRSS
jgi:predicted nucleic acid-binding protein